MELQSDKLDKITPALIGARKGIFGAVKNGKGNWGAYASLEDIIYAINGPLLEHDIFVSQASTPHDDGFQYIVTQATHISGQFMRSYTKMELAKAGDPQKALASQTYTRRAGLEALFNIPRVDDDGEHGNQTKQEKMVENFAKEVQATLTKAQQKDFVAHVSDCGVSVETAIELIKAHGYAKTADIPVDKLESLKKELKFISKGVSNVAS